MQFLSESHLSQENGLSGNVSTKDWLKFYCLSFLNLIPIIGSLVYLGILIYLAFSKDTAESLKSYIKASFIIALIVLALYVLLFVLCGGWMVAQLAAMGA